MPACLHAVSCLLWAGQPPAPLANRCRSPGLCFGAAGVLAAAQAVNLLITKDILPGAVRLPNLPPYAPVGIQDPGNSELAAPRSRLPASTLRSALPAGGASLMQQEA